MSAPARLRKAEWGGAKLNNIYRTTITDTATQGAPPTDVDLTATRRGTYQSVQQSVCVYDIEICMYTYILYHTTGIDRRAHGQRGGRYCIVTLTSLSKPHS